MIYMGGEVIEEIEDKADFFDILKRNPGVVVIKFGAEWCAPSPNHFPSLMSAIVDLPDISSIII